MQFELLEDLIDITSVPFSDRGSRLLIFASPEQHRLTIKLAERLTSIQPGIESYLSRPPFIQDMCLVDGEGETLSYNLKTYPHALLFKTRLGTFSLAFQGSDVLAFGLPEGFSAGISFRVRTHIRETDERGGALLGVRNLSYRTNGQVIMNEMRAEKDAHDVTFIVGGGKDLAIHLEISNASHADTKPAPASKTLSAAEARWDDWFARAPEVDERFRLHYYYAWWVMGNNLINPLGQVKYEAMMPSLAKYVGVWNWDSCFHALAFRHLDVELARDQLRTILAAQLPNGMIPDVVYDEGVVAEIDHPIHAAVTKPPVIAWAALKINEVDPTQDFLREIYGPLMRWNAWWFGMGGDNAKGLAHYTHPYSSGLDDSPLWDYGMPVKSPDLNTYLCIQMDSLAVMAEALGKQTEAEMWRWRSAALLQHMIAEFWDEQAGLFQAKQGTRRIPVVTPFNLYPLWTGQLSQQMHDRLISHLTDPDQFWGRYALPTVARDDPHYVPDVMWRGPVWVNINYIFIEALRKVGETTLADELMEKTLSMVMEHVGMYEYYHAETGGPPITAAPGFGWTAAVFIDLAVQASREKE